LKFTFIHDAIEPVLTSPEAPPATNAGATTVCNPSGPIFNFVVKAPAVVEVLKIRDPGNTPAVGVAATSALKAAAIPSEPSEVVPLNARAKLPSETANEVGAAVVPLLREKKLTLGSAAL
jgi:hypothetical protein